MRALGKVWKAVVGAEGAGCEGTGSTIPRDVVAARPVPAFEPWDAAEEASETRAAERFVPHRTATMLTTGSGKRVPARIINLSRTGVALEADLAGFTPEDVALVGTRPVVPGRRIALGVVFLFKKPLDPRLCGPDIVL